MLTKIKLAVYAALIITFLSLFLMNRNLRLENTRINSNVEQLSVLLDDTIQTFKVNDSINATKVIKLQYKLNEMEESAIIDKQLINDLNIKIKKISTYSHTEAVTVYNDTIVLKDTLTLLDGIKTPVRTFKESNRWHTIEGTITPDEVFTKVVHREELEYIEYYSKKKFLFIPYGKRRDSQIIISKNPYTQIVKSVFITKNN